MGIIAKHRGESGIVYCMSRKSVEATAEWLRQHGVRALPYHAGLSDADRHRNQDAFACDEADVIVATIAFGMGIDKSNVRFVVHQNMPRSIEAWYQEMGRAGRDGLGSDCVILYSWADVIGYDRFLDEIDDPELRRESRRKTVELFELLDAGACRHQAVVRYFDETIAACGASCDVCRGAGIEAIVAPATLRSTGRLRGAAAMVAVEPDGDFDTALFDRLRALRKRIAAEEGVPAYIVFSDAVLRHMARVQPRSRDELLQVPGIGPVKLDRYGDAFLEQLHTGAVEPPP